MNAKPRLMGPNMAQAMIEFLGPDRFDTLGALGEATHVLVADLRDPALAPLLRPAPTPSDQADAVRPGASDRSGFQARRALTRSLVARISGQRVEDIVIGYDAPGAPRVKDAACEISVSGRGPFAAIALSRHPVGVDLEILHEDVEIVADVLHPVERHALRELSAAEARHAFIEIWTAKEAYLKALGSGLNINPSTVAIAIEGSNIRAIAHDGGTRLREGAVLHTVLDGREIVVAAVVLANPKD